MLNEKFTFCFEIFIKWNLKNSHPKRLKSAKYKIHVKKKTFNMNEVQQNQSISQLIISCQKVPNLCWDGYVSST